VVLVVLPLGFSHAALIYAIPHAALTLTVSQAEGRKHDGSIDATEFDFRLGNVETRQLLALMKGGRPPSKEHEGGSEQDYHFRRLEFEDLVKWIAYLKRWNYDSLEAVMEVRRCETMLPCVRWIR
jgi:hypothetical protein